MPDRSITDWSKTLFDSSVSTTFGTCEPRSGLRESAKGSFISASLKPTDRQEILSSVSLIPPVAGLG